MLSDTDDLLAANMSRTMDMIEAALISMGSPDASKVRDEVRRIVTPNASAAREMRKLGMEKENDEDG